jgi:pimeloyl-ACP methyl ester carboxylesterase
LRAGYAVVSADANGNAFGNPASREDYRLLIKAALQHYGPKPVLFVAESMGALAALALISEDTGRQGQEHGRHYTDDGPSA